ncbi:EamA family transporter [Thermomonas sp. HDW16]|uniref:EamA family transporter n=1 Tax=Thermomonas sp. HDW16 TaxID=2714945 RepID=UPI0014097AE5|nr:EamA family transporter [Thermomonas sp. HDW16]QIL19574.1 EamA family transporter [Thermomonas sp. HDW16]
MTTTGWLFWALLSAVFAALTAVFAKVGVSGVDSDLATLIRTAIVLALLVPLVLATGKWSDPFALPPRTLVFLALSAASTAASWICYYRALQIGDTAQVTAIDKTSVVLVAVFALVFLGERLSWLSWLGVLLIGSGAVVLSVGASRGH